MISTRTKVKPPSDISVTFSEIATNSFVAEVGWTPAVSAWPNSYYVIYRDGIEIDTGISVPSYRDFNIVAGVDYVYEVATVNVNEVEGDVGGAASLTMPGYPAWETGWSLSIDQNTTQSIAARASDPRGSALTFSKQGGTAPGTVTVNSAGTVAVASTSQGSYSLIIRASNGQLVSDYTATLAVTVPITAPGAPANFAVVGQSSSSIAGSWQQGSGQAPTAYDVSYSLTGNNPQTPGASGWISLTLSSALATSFTKSGLASGTRYYFRNRATNAGQASSYSVDDDATFSVGGTIYTIPTGTANYDASNVVGGDTIIIARKADGTRGPLTITGAIGVSASNRIRVISDPAGLVTMRPNTPGSVSFLFLLTNCHHVDFDFDNALAVASGARNRCGLKLTHAEGATTGNKESLTAYLKLNAASGQAASLTDDFTMSRLWIDGGWDTSGSLLANGLGISGNHKAVATKGGGRWQENILYEDCFIENIEGEGIYQGSNYADSAVPCRNIGFSRVTVLNTGQDGINVKGTWEGTNYIDDCVITDCGRVVSNVGVLSGIAVMSSKYRVSNTKISGSGGPGIRFYCQNGPSRTAVETGYGTYATFAAEVYNCDIQTAGQNASTNGYGLMTGAQNNSLTMIVPAFYSTTIRGCRDQGVNLSATGGGNGFVRNIISLGNGSPQIAVNSAGTTNSDNLTSGITEAACFDSGTDSHLTTAGLAAALGCGGTRGTNYSASDFDGVNRSATPSLAHKGAYES